MTEASDVFARIGAQIPDQAGRDGVPLRCYGGVLRSGGRLDPNGTAWRPTATRVSPPSTRTSPAWSRRGGRLAAKCFTPMATNANLGASTTASHSAEQGNDTAPQAPAQGGV